MASELNSAGALPPEIAGAHAALRQGMQGGGEDAVCFVPVRHHSPACSLALSALLKSVRPVAVLIEGPDDLNHLLPLLQHEKTQPPIAWMCQSRVEQSGETASEGEDGEVTSALPTGDETRTSFFPFCAYSPEWIAAREGAALGAQIAMIDLPWSDKAWARSEREESDDSDDSDGAVELVQARSLMHERHFAHSRYLTRMAESLGCTDHHELWERMFELRAPAQLQSEWRDFFGDVFAWCAMARLDYEPEVLEAELSLPRERHMAAQIRAWRAKVKGPIVVVTGGFHTLELVQNWRNSAPPKTAKKASSPTKTIATSEAWLIRYSFEKLDALNGYSAGMPSPGYHQAIWERMQAGDAKPHNSVALEYMAAFARQMREAQHTDAASTALVQAAAAQAERLAQLRGNIGPGRQDLLDAIRSCYIKGAIDEGTTGFHTEVRRFLAGTRLGDIPPSAGSPPLIEDARRLARAAGVRLDDSTQRTVRFDLYRKARHRERSRFFHAMAYLDAHFAGWVGGPDFLAGTRLNLLFEEWRAAWSPMVEARLIELSTDGASVEAVCLARLEREQHALSEQGRARSASAAMLLLLRACVIGLHAQLPRLLKMLSDHLDEDASLASVLDCGHRLVTLWRAREPLGVQQNPQIAALLARIGPAALFLLPQLGDAKPEGEPQAVKLLLSLRELGRMLGSVEGVGSASSASLALDAELLRARLTHFATTPQVACGVAGAAAALLYLDGDWDDAALQSAVALRFGPGAQADESVRYLAGLMSAAPELMLRLPAVLQAFDALVRDWDEDAFIAYLPDLRQSFTALRPQETAQLASRVASLYGEEDRDGGALASMHYETSEADLHMGLMLERMLAVGLKRDGLESWTQG